MLSELLSLSLCKRKLHQVVLQLQFYVTKPAFVTYDDILRKHWLVCLIASWSDRRKLLESQGWYFNSNWFVLGINLFFLVCDDRGMKNIFFWGSSEQARLKCVDPVCFVKAFGSLLVFLTNDLFAFLGRIIWSLRFLYYALLTFVHCTFILSSHAFALKMETHHLKGVRYAKILWHLKEYNREMMQL